MFEPITVLISVAISVLIILLFAPSRREEKYRNEMTRRAVVALAKDLNRTIKFYDEIRKIGIYTISFDEEFVDFKDLQKLGKQIDNIDNIINNANAKIDNIAKNAKQTDEIIAKGVDALATHLKLEIMPYKKEATERQILFNVVKLKKHKK